MDAGLLLVRTILGLALAAHGTRKLFGWFGGHGLVGTGGFLESLGFRPGRLFALAAGLSETGGGALVVLGLLGPVGPALIVMIMLVAIYTVHFTHGFFAQGNGVELPLSYTAAAVALAFAGPGSISLDSALGIDLHHAETAWILLAVAILLSLGNLGLRRPTAPTPADAPGRS